jgi:hypothetical protein
MRITTNRNTLVIVGLVALLILQFTIGYFFIQSRYKNDQTSVAFDNYVNENLSFLFSNKTYANESYSDLQLVNPDLNFVDKSANVYMVNGFTHRISDEQGKFIIEVRKVDQEPKEVTLSKEDSIILCRGDVCNEGIETLSELIEGDLIYIFQTKYSSGKISNYIQID